MNTYKIMDINDRFVGIKNAETETAALDQLARQWGYENADKANCAALHELNFNEYFQVERIR